LRIPSASEHALVTLVPFGYPIVNLTTISNNKLPNHGKIRVFESGFTEQLRLVAVTSK